MVKLAPALPKENESNGLTSHTRDLVGNYDTGTTVPVIAIVRTQEVTRNKEYATVPKLEIVHIEGAFSDDDADAVRSLLVSLHDDRVRASKQPLDFPDEEADFGEAVAAIEAPDVVDAELVDENEEA